MMRLMTGLVVFLARSQFRRRRRALLLLAVFVGVVSGISISLIAGSRRSSSVVDRYFAAAIPYDVQVFSPLVERDALLAIPGAVRA